MGLPGGRQDAADSDLFTTAVRETDEEVGISLEPEALLGMLDDVWPRSPIPRLIVVRPHVFAISERPHLTLSDEVAEVHWVPLVQLRRPEVYRQTIVQLRGQELSFPAYDLEAGVVWGLTERILTLLLKLVS
jgi:8-oxo-dGTP pyrophosphatase MutT (NUDIX family)